MQLIIHLYQDAKTIRDIASAIHMSFGDIGKIIKKYNGSTSDSDGLDLSNKSKLTQAIFLFKNGMKRRSCRA